MIRMRDGRKAWLRHSFDFGVQSALVAGCPILTQDSFGDHLVYFRHGGLIDFIGGGLVASLNRRRHFSQRGAQAGSKRQIVGAKPDILPGSFLC